MKVRFKKLTDLATTPTYSKEGDAGMDITAIAIKYSPERSYVEYSTGLAVEIPEGYVGLLFPRSSVSNVDLQLCNSVGVVDSGYRGEIKFRYRMPYNTSGANISRYKEGDRVGQLVIMPYPQVELVEVDELSDTERGKGGYGSTGQ